MNVIKKGSLFFSLIACLLISCYENEEGCQDTLASNFDASADVPCEDCCAYPSISLSVQHVLDTFVYSASRKVYNGLGDTFLIIQAGLLMHNAVLTQGASSLETTDQRSFNLLDGSSLTEKDDFTLVRTTTSSYTLGTHQSQGDITAIAMDVGLTSQQLEIDPEALPESHPLSTEAGFRSAGSYIGGYADILYDTMTMDTVRYHLPALLNISYMADTAFNVDFGNNATLRLKIDYQKWMEGINFVVIGNDEAAVTQAIVNDLPNAISLAD